MAEQTTKRATKKALDAFCASNNITPESIWGKLSTLYPSKYIQSEELTKKLIKGLFKAYNEVDDATITTYLKELDESGKLYSYTVESKVSIEWNSKLDSILEKVKAHCHQVNHTHEKSLLEISAYGVEIVGEQEHGLAAHHTAQNISRTRVLPAESDEQEDCRNGDQHVCRNVHIDGHLKLRAEEIEQIGGGGRAFDHVRAENLGEDCRCLRGRLVHAEIKIRHEQDGEDHREHQKIERDQLPEASAQHFEIALYAGGSVFLERVGAIVAVVVKGLEKAGLYFFLCQNQNFLCSSLPFIITYISPKVKKNGKFTNLRPRPLS